MGFVDGENLLSIGSFSVLTGLSIVALRHYDDVGLLRPRSVDARNGYRRYGLEQVPDARMIRALRAVEVPVEMIRGILDAPNNADASRGALGEHRDRLIARSREVTDMIETLNDYIERGVRMAESVACRVDVQREARLTHAGCRHPTAFAPTRRLSYAPPRARRARWRCRADVPPQTPASTPAVTA